MDRASSSSSSPSGMSDKLRAVVAAKESNALYLKAAGSSQVSEYSTGSDDVIGSGIDAFCEGNKIDRPPLSAALRVRLNHVQPYGNLWSTDLNAEDPYRNVTPFERQAVAAHDMPGYALFGISGGDLQKVYSLFVVEENLAVFVQCPVGRNYGESVEEERFKIHLLTVMMQDLQKRVHDAQEAGMALPGKKLIVVWKEPVPGEKLSHQRYVWLKEGDHDYDSLQWTTARTQGVPQLKEGPDHSFLESLLRSIPKPLAKREVVSGTYSHSST